VHLRRALLLFAIVLGLAAVAASVSRPGDTDEPPPPATQDGQAPRATDGEGVGPPTELTFLAADPDTQRVAAGQAATISVEVEDAGQVEIADLGLSAVGDPLTPARFDLLTREAGRYEITFTPAGDEALETRVGTLVVAAEP
jgi:hypothetical protein